MMWRVKALIAVCIALPLDLTGKAGIKVYGWCVNASWALNRWAEKGRK